MTSFWSLAWKITFQFQKGNEKILFSAFFFFSIHTKKQQEAMCLAKREVPPKQLRISACYRALAVCLRLPVHEIQNWNLRGKKGGGGINSGNVFLPCRQTVLTTAQRRKRSQSPIALYKKKWLTNTGNPSLHCCKLTQVVLWQWLLSALCTDSTSNRCLALVYNQKLPL